MLTFFLTFQRRLECISNSKSICIRLTLPIYKELARSFDQLSSSNSIHKLLKGKLVNPQLTSSFSPVFSTENLHENTHTKKCIPHPHRVRSNAVASLLLFLIINFSAPPRKPNPSERSSIAPSTPGIRPPRARFGVCADQIRRPINPGVCPLGHGRLIASGPWGCQGPPVAVPDAGAGST